jgi:hypothetical protein
VFLKQTSLAAFRGMIGARLQKKTAAFFNEIFPHQKIFPKLRIRIHLMRSFKPKPAILRLSGLGRTTASGRYQNICKPCNLRSAATGNQSLPSASNASAISFTPPA